MLTRRVKQGVAEWYVLDLLEKSWGGFEIHTEAGFNIGKPCYGYRAKKVPHPVPAKRAKGIKKTRLEADPAEAAVVRKAFRWRVVERLGYQAIAERLNADLTANPPPTPVDPAAAAGLWTYSNVRDMLTNPKHTGHMVWNRRARKGSGKNRMNPVSEWVWSAEPVHEALVDLETFVQAQQVADRRERSRTAAGLNPGPQAKHVYRLRSYLFCCSCGRRMFGNTKRQVSWYACAPKKAYRPDGHPVIFRVREDHLLDGLAGFLSGRVFGPCRHQLLAAELKTASEAARHERASRISALRRSITETETKSKRLIRNLELTDGIDQDFIRDINERRAELRARRDELQRKLAAAEDQAHRAPNPALLGQLPVTPVDLASMPDEISRLAIRSPPAANPLRLHDAHRNLHDHPDRRHDRRRRTDQPGNDRRRARRTRHRTSSSRRRTRCPIPTRGWSVLRPQQDSNLRSRLRRPSLRSSEFVRPACLDLIVQPSDGHDHSGYIPDHGNCPVTGRTLQGMARARSGQAPVSSQAGSGMITRRHLSVSSLLPAPPAR